MERMEPKDTVQAFIEASAFASNAPRRSGFLPTSLRVEGPGWVIGMYCDKCRVMTLVLDPMLQKPEHSDQFFLMRCCPDVPAHNFEFPEVSLAH